MFVATHLLVGWTLAVRLGYPPLGLFSVSADAAFIQALPARWRAMRSDWDLYAFAHA